MTEEYTKYKKVINTPQESMGDVFTKIKNWEPDNNWKQLVRVPGATAAFSLYLLLWLITKIVAENPIIEKLTDNNANKKINSSSDNFFKRAINMIKKQKKKSPNASAFIAYYMVLLSLVGAGKISYENSDSIKQVYVEWKHRKGTKIKNMKINPLVSDKEWNQQMDAIWPYLYMETVLTEGFINEAYADVGDSGGYLTIGSGFMIGPANPKTKMARAIIQERKAFFKKVLGKQYVNGIKISYDENRILVRKFYEKYVWPQMKRDFKVPMDVHLFIELCIGSYNRGNGIYKKDGNGIRQAVNNGKSAENIANKFDDLYTVGNDGLLPKYGIAAHRILGHISDEDVLNSSANSVYQFKASDIWYNGKLKPYENIAQDLCGFTDLFVKKNGKTYLQHKVREYMTPEEIDCISLGLAFTSSQNDFKILKEEIETKAEVLNEQGEFLFDNGDYRGAIVKFEQALKQNPELHIVYSNLSLAYYKLAEYQNGINVVSDFINSTYFKSAPATVKGYTYYNAALCYEKIGDNESNISLKKSYYERAKKNAEIGEKIANTKYYAFNKRIVNKMSELMNQKSKSIAFNDGIVKIKEKQNKSNNNQIYNFNNENMV